jgi:fructose-1,6-bisphosphatase/inositol monophosphatase family enzyme
MTSSFGPATAQLPGSSSAYCTVRTVVGCYVGSAMAELAFCLHGAPSGALEPTSETYDAAALMPLCRRVQQSLAQQTLSSAQPESLQCSAAPRLTSLATPLRHEGCPQGGFLGATCVLGAKGFWSAHAGSSCWAPCHGL